MPSTPSAVTSTTSSLAAPKMLHQGDSAAHPSTIRRNAQTLTRLTKIGRVSAQDAHGWKAGGRIFLNPLASSVASGAALLRLGKSISVMEICQWELSVLKGETDELSCLAEQHRNPIEVRRTHFSDLTWTLDTKVEGHLRMKRKKNWIMYRQDTMQSISKQNKFPPLLTQVMFSLTENRPNSNLRPNATFAEYKRREISRWC